MKKRALLSVSDKTGIVEFARQLSDLGYEIISTGGTESAIKQAGISVLNISEITGFPECLDGRVKTLHPAVHAGLLARRDNPDHIRQLNDLNLNTIDVVAVNLYPFEAAIAKKDCDMETAVENIDIGGPTMLRSAAKNYKDVLVIVDPNDYSMVIDSIKTGTKDEKLNLNLMYKVYRHTAYYDTVIADYLMKKTGIDFPETLTCGYKKVVDLRYGENPHQKAAFYKEAGAKEDSLPLVQQLQGKELSYNNINDSFGAVELIKEFSQPAAAAIKHANPCGVALGSDVLDAYKRAHMCDPISIFGGIVAVNRTVDGAAAAEMIKTFLEVVIAPDYTDEALKVFTAKPNLRVLKLAGIDKPADKGRIQKYVGGGLLVQDTDSDLTGELKTVTKVSPNKQQTEQMLFAYKIVKHVKSNAIVLCNDFMAVGIGAGQTNRIWAANQAIEHAGEKANGAVAASDAFFPFSDCVQVLAAAGIKAIIQPGGSVRDSESIDLCDKQGLTMVFAGNRHFKH